MFTFTETTHVNAQRASEQLNARTLASAKREASRKQCFQGTTLKIFNEVGTLVAYKESGGKWVNV